MPLEKEYSIVADSTISSSPRLDVVHDAQPLIKRPTRTYGKRREEPVESELDTSSLSAFSSASRDAVHNTAPPGLSEQIPSTSSTSSPRTRANSDACDNYISEDSPIDIPSKYPYDWRARLRQIDMDEDEDDGGSPNSKGDDAPTNTLFGPPLLLQGTAGTTTTPNIENHQYASSLLPSASNDIFGDDSLSKQSPSHGPPGKKNFSLSSPQVAPTILARRATNKTDSDSEEEPSKPSSSSPSSSSQPLHNINTPKSKSSYTTPPTSDDDMPVNISAKGRSSGKRKATSTRSSVTPLTLVEGPLSEPKARHVISDKRTKVKAPTKKDRQEMVKERSRLAAESNAFIPRETVNRYTKEQFFKMIGKGSKQQSAPINNQELVPASDPIEAYSSPPVNASHGLHPSLPATGSPKPLPMQMQLSPAPNDSDDEDIPEVSDMFKKIAAEKHKEDLKAKKMRALEFQKRHAAVSLHDDDDLDLEVVRPNPKTGVKEEDEHRQSTKKNYISEPRKQQLRLALINPSKQKLDNPSAILGVHSMHVESSSDVLRHGGRMDQLALNRLMVSEAQKEARKMASKKEEEWKKHGGRVALRPETQGDGFDTALKTIVAKVANAAAESREINLEDEGEDASDEDWDPALRGSASPELEDDGRDDVEEAKGENDENMTLDQDITMADGEDLEALEEPKMRTNRRMVVDSDSEEENDENDENAPMKSRTPHDPARYRRATSSCELTEGEQDKENNTRLMCDDSEDKENLRHVRNTFHSNDTPSPSHSPSLTVRDWSGRSERADEARSTQKRKPFQELASDESPSFQSQSSSLTQSFADKLQQSSQNPTALTPAATLKPFIGRSLQVTKSFSGFSQLFDGEADNTFVAAPLLQPSFADLFESKAGQSDLSADEAVSDENVRTTLKRADTLGLTQEVHAVANLQPGFQAADNLMRKADSIFEKEQGFVMEAAVKKPAKKPDLYVNDHGFLTQTRPAEGIPDIYRPSPSQRPYGGLRGTMISPSQSHGRVPLRTLSLSSAYQPESPEGPPLRRLRKNATPPPGEDNLHLGSPTSTPPRKRNAFDLLAQGAAKARKRDELKQKQPSADVAAFFENEAAESDEDDTFGFGKSKKDDDEEDGEDLDKTLDVLMDDNLMDEDTVAADLVLEKFKEQEEARDQDLEKLHMAAIQGELRRKRTRGVGVDDSDEDSEDDGNERARRAMKKQRTTDRGDIKHLEANEATRSFAETYNRSLKDDDDEFSYLNKESQPNDLLKDSRSADDDSEGSGYEEEEEPKTISFAEVRRRVQEGAAEVDTEDIAMNPADLSWLDHDDEEDTPRVKTINSRPRPRAHLRDQDASGFDGAMGGLLGKPSEPTNASSKQWCAQEFKSRNAGTSRSVGGSAITGHTKARRKPAGKAVSTQASELSTSTTGRKAVKPERSMLSAIADKSRHFG